MRAVFVDCQRSPVPIVSAVPDVPIVAGIKKFEELACLWIKDVGVFVIGSGSSS